jgi:hypothetical protein
MIFLETKCALRNAREAVDEFLRLNNFEEVVGILDVLRYPRYFLTSNNSVYLLFRALFAFEDFLEEVLEEREERLRGSTNSVRIPETRNYPCATFASSTT